jgi:SAM-dependent methyltransferase
MQRRLRALARRVALLLLRPYANQQAQVNAALFETVRTLQARAAELGSEVGAHSESLERLEALNQDLVSAAESLRRRIAEVDRALRTELYEVPYVAGAPFEPLTTSVGTVTGYRSLPSAEDADSAYAGFEDLFRGPPERVTELQLPYLALVKGHQPVLDVGCGRGEFLTLIAEAGIAGSGVDSDPGMVERCRVRGLAATLGDGIEHLAGLADASVGTVFCAQVIEHLPVDQLSRLLKHARRKLIPGGLFIAETVNPHSLTGMKMFWVDLTHQHPIFPEVALAMCGLAGFAPAYVFAPGHTDFEAARFHANAYAVVATNPEAPGR